MGAVSRHNDGENCFETFPNVGYISITKIYNGLMFLMIS